MTSYNFYYDADNLMKLYVCDKLQDVFNPIEVL